LIRRRTRTTSPFPYTTLFRSLDAFGNTAVHTLARLAEQGFLLHESRTDLNATRSDYEKNLHVRVPLSAVAPAQDAPAEDLQVGRSEEHTSELQSRFDLVCRLL